MVIVIGSYIDGSNLHESAALICVGGCAARVDDWPRWEHKWQELLDFADLPRWHHTDFMARVKRKKRSDPVVRWKDAEWLIARRMLCEAFEEVTPTCFAYAVKRSDYDELRALYEIPEDPYYFLLDRCMWRVVQGMFEHPVDTGIAVYCDQDRDEDLVKALSKWHADYLRGGGHYWHPELRTRKVITSYGSNVDYVPLQAADVVAHEFMRYGSGSPPAPFVPTNHPTGSWILDRLVPKFPWFTQCFDKKWLEAELSGRLFPKDQPPGFGFAPARRREED